MEHGTGENMTSVCDGSEQGFEFFPTSLLSLARSDSHTGTWIRISLFMDLCGDRVIKYFDTRGGREAASCHQEGRFRKQ